MRIISGVSVLYNGVVYYLPRPFRHHHVHRAMNTILKIAYPRRAEFEEGFVDNKQVHLNRTDALRVARLAKQLNDRPLHSDELYSENVWAHYDTSTLEALARDFKYYKLP